MQCLHDLRAKMSEGFPQASGDDERGVGGVVRCGVVWCGTLTFCTVHHGTVHRSLAFFSFCLFCALPLPIPGVSE
jgi:hypothetical protein